MKKFFEIFRIDKKEKISDKTFMFNIVACMAGIVICLSSLTAVTWAWFGGSVSSASNTIQTANYKMTVKVMSGDTEISSSSPSGYQYLLEAGKEYTVILSGEGTGSGYCRVTNNRDSSKIYYTSQVRASDAEPTRFTLKFAVATTVDLQPCWGTYIVESEKRELQNGGSYVDLLSDGEVSEAESEEESSESEQ